MTICSSGKICQSRSAVSMPSMPGGMRTSTKATVGGQPAATKRSSRAQPSPPWEAKLELKAGELDRRLGFAEKGGLVASGEAGQLGAEDLAEVFVDGAVVVDDEEAVWQSS